MYNGIFKISSPENSYWLGLLMADGCMHHIKNSNRYALSLRLKLEDKYLIQQFRDYIECTEYKIGKHVYKNSIVSSLQITNQELCKDLLKLGVIPRKTRLLNENSIPPYYFSHFLRGVFDGDGSFCNYIVNGKWKSNFAIYGHKDFLEAIINQLRINYNINMNVYSNRQELGVYVISTNKHSLIQDIYNFIYCDKNFYMKRKFKSFQKWIKLNKNVEYKIKSKKDAYINGRGYNYIICKLCGKKILKLAQDKYKFCSRKCYMNYRKINSKGNTHAEII